MKIKEAVSSKTLVPTRRHVSENRNLDTNHYKNTGLT
jgi:hypothetical protein